MSALSCGVLRRKEVALRTGNSGRKRQRKRRTPREEALASNNTRPAPLPVPSFAVRNDPSHLRLQTIALQEHTNHELLEHSLIQDQDCLPGVWLNRKLVTHISLVRKPEALHIRRLRPQIYICGATIVSPSLSKREGILTFLSSFLFLDATYSCVRSTGKLDYGSIDNFLFAVCPTQQTWKQLKLVRTNEGKTQKGSSSSNHSLCRCGNSGDVGQPTL